MREIKFRAWIPSEKRMGIPFELRPELNRGGTFCDEIIFLQYTGIKDKNGQEIYDRDIVRYSEVGWVEEEIGYIECNAPNGGYNLKVLIDDGEEYVEIDSNFSFEIIGNIYENTKLMEVI